MARPKNKLTRTQRMQAIRKALLRGKEVAIDVLARQLKVSGMTVRRDLEQLENQGDIVRTYGGAVLAQRLTFEFSFHDQEHSHNTQKRAIAQQAAALVQNGQVVMLDTGTTTLHIAQALVGKQDVTLITTSLAIVSKVQFSPGIKVVLLGGFLRRGSPDMHGPLTEQNVEQFKADIAFMGADAIDDQGTTYTSDLQVLNLDRKMAANATRVVVVADSSKFGKNEMCKVLGPEEYDLVLTDARMDKTLLKQLQRKKIKIKLT
ncbi:MAG: DeoR/GlpR transcriptional regulator [Sedimentisphaerales bacterium]|nr:DeoR/GlpR transcriptional regulator [Sedimentisphaerales bacterium]